MSCSPNPVDGALRRFSALPPGTRPGDCERSAATIFDADPDQLWAGCTAGQKERIAQQFARVRADDVRDALLDAPPPARQPAAPIPRELGATLWRAWIRYRDQVLDQLHRNGQIELESLTG
jgi:hypothetical protein